jgi:hypothetical protein
VTQFSDCAAVEGLACADSMEGQPLSCIRCSPAAFADMRQRLATLTPELRADFEAKLNTLPEETQRYLRAKLDVSIDPELDLAADMEATDDTGARITLAANRVRITKRPDGRWEVEAPMNIRAGRRLARISDPDDDVEYDGTRWRLAIRDPSGRALGEIVATVGEMTGDGDSANGDVEKIELKTDWKPHLMGEDGRFHRIGASVEVELVELTLGGTLGIEPRDEMAETLERQLNDTARRDRLALAEVGAVVEFAKQNLENRRHIRRARVLIKVENSWLRARGGPRFIRIVRVSDDNQTQVLPTSYAGVDEDGLARFEGESEQGLSVFALYSVKYLEPTATAVATPAPTVAAAVTAPPATPTPTPLPVAGAGVDYFTIALAVLIVGIVAFAVFSAVSKKQEGR